MKTIITAIALSLVSSIASADLGTLHGSSILDKYETEFFGKTYHKVITAEGQFTIGGSLENAIGYVAYVAPVESALESAPAPKTAKATQEVVEAAPVALEAAPAEDNREDNKDRRQNRLDSALNSVISAAKAGQADPMFTTQFGKIVDLRTVSFAKYGRFYTIDADGSRTIVTAFAM